MSNIKSNCEHVLIDFITNKPDWKYVKSKRSYVKKISKDSFVDVYTGMTSSVDFVKFQFTIHIGHKLVGKADKFRRKNNWAIVWHNQKWIPKELNNGLITVYDHNQPELSSFEERRKAGKKNYIKLEDFSDTLESIFSLAEAEINRLFDTSSEEALIKSVIKHPIGTFNPNEVLLIQLMLGNRGYYKELIDFYEQPLEKISSLTYEPFGRQKADQTMENYLKGDFPLLNFNI